MARARRYKGPRSPILLTLATLVVAILIYLVKANAQQLSDTVFHFDWAVFNIITGICIIALTIGWLSWLFFNSGWPLFWSRILPVILFVSIVGFLVCYRPIMQGALTIDRWEPRFWLPRSLSLSPETKLANLAAETEFDFPQFFGPNRNGVIDNFGTRLTDLNQQRTLVWKKPIGNGWSGFAAVNGFAVTMMQDAGDELVVCYEIESGDLIWTYRHARRHDDVLGGVGPRSTPTIDDGNVYAVGANGLVVCLDGTDGTLIWKQDLSNLLDIKLTESKTPAGLAYQVEDNTLDWGRAGSPLIYEDLLIVPAGGSRGATQWSLIAFDKQTGEENWRGGADGIGYSSPIVATLAGREQIVNVNESSASGHDPTSGEMLWSFDWPGHSDSDANTSQATIVDEHHILLSKGYGIGAELVKITQNGDGAFSADSVWKNQRVLKTKMTSPVVRDGYAYGLSDGILECVEQSNGDRVWKRGRYGHGQLLRIGEKLLIHSEWGFLALVDCSPDGFNERSRFDTIDGVSWNTICVFDQYVLIRSDLEVACYLMAHANGPDDKAESQTNTNNEKAAGQSND